MMSGTVIYLNGANLSGKSTIAKNLQQKLPAPYVHYQFDSFLESLPPNADVESVNKLANAFINSFKVFLDAGNNLIIDHIILNEDRLKFSMNHLEGYRTFFVKVYCPLETLEVRELGKYSKLKGIANAQYEKVYQDYTYDMEFDTSKTELDEITSTIVDYVGHNEPMAFSVMNH